MGYVEGTGGNPTRRLLAAGLSLSAAAALALGVASSAQATTWSPAATIAPVPQSGSPYPVLSISGNYQVAMSANGTATAIWVDLDSTNGSIMSATKAPGSSSWVPKRVSPLGNFSYGESSAVTVAADGTTTVVWQIAGNVFAATRPAGGADFSAPETISSGNNASYPVIGAADDGSVTVAYGEYASGLSSINVRQRAAGAATFGSPQRLSDPAANASISNYSRYLSVAPDGTAAVTWLEPGTNTGWKVRAAIRRPGQATFDPSQDIGTDIASTSNANPTVAAGTGGSAIAAWEYFGTSAPPTVIRTQSQAAGSTQFDPAQQDLATPGATSNELPAVATNGKRAIIAWKALDNTAGTADAGTAVRDPGETSFGHQQTLADPAVPGTQGPPQPGLGVAGDGSAILTWFLGNGSTITPLAASMPADTPEFGPRQVIAPGDPSIGQWGFAMAANGSAALIWNEPTGITGATSEAISYTLTTTRSGDGSGTITSSPSGIDCGSSCTWSFNLASEVTLTAAPASGSTFGGWGGACSGSSTTCKVTVDAAKSVSATFAKAGPGPSPSNGFTIASTRARGSAVVSRVRVPSAGRLSQRGTYRSSGAAAVKTACTDSRTTPGAGTYTLTCRLNAAARKQRKKGALRVRVRTTFTPTGGTARSTFRTVTFRSLQPNYTG